MCTPPTEGTATADIKIDNARTRVTEWRFAQRGDNTGWHRHDYDYVVVPQTGRRDQADLSQLFRVGGGKAGSDGPTHGIAQKRDIASDAFVFQEITELRVEKGTVLRAFRDIR